MNITRLNVDFGNSIYMALIDGYYIEMPTNVVEIPKEKALGHFVANVSDPKDLYDRLLISIGDGYEEKYYLVGESAEKEVLGNNHIKKLHNKIESDIPYVTFLASLAYYYEIKNTDYDISEENKIIIDYFQTMLPIWLLVKAEKFSIVQEQMAARFRGVHNIKIHTPGVDKMLTIEVKESKCRIEGEVARWAIKKNFRLEDNPESEKFNYHHTLVVDIGGGTIDLVLLPPGLDLPKSRNSMEFIEDIPYLAHLDKLRRDKLLEHFSEVRALEAFIVKNIGCKQMEQKDIFSGETINLKEIIHRSLYEYAKLLLEKVNNRFQLPKDKQVKYLYIGGVAEVLQDAIREVIEEKYNREVFADNHIFIPESRKLNLYGLEIISINETQVLQENVNS